MVVGRAGSAASGAFFRFPQTETDLLVRSDHLTGPTLGSRQLDRALLDAVGDTFLANPAIRAALADVVLTLDALVRRAQEHGTVRRDVGALDVLLMMKGVCEATGQLRQIDPEIPNRQLDLVRSALLASGSSQPLRGRAPTLEDIERAFAPTTGAAARSPTERS